MRTTGKVDHVRLVAIRPEDITVELSPSIDVNVNNLKVTIRDVADLGPFVMINADAGLLIKTVMAKNSFLEKGLENGKEVWLKFKDDAVKIIN